MNDRISTDTVLNEAEPLTSNDLVGNLLQDLVAGNGANDVATEFVEQFVLTGREETPQILTMFEMPSESLVESLKGIVGQAYQVQIDALDKTGIRFIDELKASVKTKMTALANEPP